MTRLPFFAGLMLLAGVSGAAAETRQVCNATVDVTDSDPAGTHVRSAPGGKIIASLRMAGDGWIEVHLTAQVGDWYEIDRAKLIDSVQKTLFRGKGYLHKSMLGVSGFQNGATLYVQPDGKRSLVTGLAGDQPVDLLGCSGPFLKVKAGKFTGWTKEACTNTNTTCA